MLKTSLVIVVAVQYDERTEKVLILKTWPSGRRTLSAMFLADFVKTCELIEKHHPDITLTKGSP
jgi:hypothetical protein